jgi:mRNA-degrading endonuclease RelE of RelBE toxin-antitoxin system
MTVFFSRSSLKYLKKLELKTAKKLVEACENLPGEGDVRKYKGGSVKNIFRLRLGKYRILFIKDKEIIKILKIDTRGDIYKK